VLHCRSINQTQKLCFGCILGLVCNCKLALKQGDLSNPLINLPMSKSQGDGFSLGHPLSLGPYHDLRLHGNTFSLLVRAFRAGCLSLVSLSSGPRLSAPSPTSSRPSSPAPPPLPDHRAPPSSAPRVPPSRYHLAFIFPPLIPLLNPPPSSMALKPLTSALTPPPLPPLPGAPLTPIKGEHHPRSSPHLSQPLFASLYARASLSPSAAASGSAPLSPGLHATA
jgi:hypothetical protein